MHTITSISDLLAFANHVQGSTGLRCWYRGHSRVSYKLAPSAHRDFTAEQERNLTNEFRSRAATRHTSTPAAGELAAWLALAQHYGLPTRLLDWTFSPLVAAYFAVASRRTPPAEDACIYAVLPSELNVHFGYEPYLYPLDARSLTELIEPAFKGTDITEKVAAAMAVECDSRMQMQQGAFTIHSLRIPLCEQQGTGQWLFKAIVPATDVPTLRYELKLLSIREDSVFPDLAALAKQVAADVRS